MNPKILQKFLIYSLLIRKLYIFLTGIHKYRIFNYQHIGEANANGNMEEYGCAFPELISEWRRVWSMNSDTYSNFPFGFVQLAQVAPEQNSGFPMIRWFQTNGTGYVPNENMQVGNFFINDKDNFEIPAILYTIFIHSYIHILVMYYC